MASRVSEAVQISMARRNLVLIVFLAIDGERQPNAYVPDPKAVSGEAAVFT